MPPHPRRHHRCHREHRSDQPRVVHPQGDQENRRSRRWRPSHRRPRHRVGDDDGTALPADPLQAGGLARGVFAVGNRDAPRLGRSLGARPGKTHLGGGDIEQREHRKQQQVPWTLDAVPGHRRRHRRRPHERLKQGPTPGLETDAPEQHRRGRGPQPVPWCDGQVAACS